MTGHRKTTLMPTGKIILFCFWIIAVGFVSILQAETLHMKPFQIRDQQMGGVTAFRAMAPSNWRIRGGLSWDSGLANLVTANVAITSPDQSAGFYAHPSPQYISGQIQNQWPQGQRYLGMEVLPMPESPAQFLRQVVLPRQRPGAVNIRLIRHRDLPEWADSVAAASDQGSGTIRGFGTCSRFTYIENGEAWEEDFYCVILISQSLLDLQNVTWLADRNLSFRARAGKLDDLQSLAAVFVASFKVEQNWYGRFLKVQRQWIAARQQGIADAGALSRAISQSNDNFDQTIMQSWQNRNRAEERASREFSEYIRDSENYYDAVNDRQVELPGGYDHAWSNSLGEYILTDDPGFDPNTDSNASWEAIRPAF